jgi:hypothetical protein
MIDLDHLINTVTVVDHAVGDIVYTMYGHDYAKTTPYTAKVVSVVDNETSQGLGVHYVLHVDTHVGDYLDLKSANRVWKTREEWEVARKLSIRKIQEFNERINAAKRKLNEPNK